MAGMGNMSDMSKKGCRWLLLIILVGCLTACLFAARQKAVIPYKAVAITGKVSPTLLGQLQFDILTYLDIKVAINPKDADLIVEVLDDAPNSTIASYGATGQISAYDLNDVVVFRVFNTSGKEVISQTQIYAVRNMNFSAHTVLSADIQQQQMIEEMRKELALQITIRLMALGRH
jgi:LPS-assembly lipoprotein